LEYEATDLIRKATGRTIRHVDVDPEDFIGRQIANGVPPDAARMITSLLVAIRDNQHAGLSDGVERALGRQPKPFEDYVAEAAAERRWNRPKAGRLVVGSGEPQICSELSDPRRQRWLRRTPGAEWDSARRRRPRGVARPAMRWLRRSG
jgi:hypothetical protein